jgi:hypothetical protein
VSLSGARVTFGAWQVPSSKTGKAGTRLTIPRVPEWRKGPTTPIGRRRRLGHTSRNPPTSGAAGRPVRQPQSSLATAKS